MRATPLAIPDERPPLGKWSKRHARLREAELFLCD
jgi:hypothetical protein